jgi:UDPglucose 6-dehydrogenase
MKITIVGAGYVGLVAAACFSQIGINVMCLDLDTKKIALLKSGKVPIYEPGLDEMIRSCQEQGRLHFTTSYEEAVAHGEIYFIAVGTPPGEDGSADLQYVLSAAKEIGDRIVRRSIIVNKSTVPVGTAEKVEALIVNCLEKRALEVEFAVVSNPEFLREGVAIRDFMEPDRIVIGARHSWAIQRMQQLYRPLNQDHSNIMIMETASAELTKYAANAMLATRISFMNELAQLAALLGADIEEVRRGIGTDPRIGPHFLYPGCGYGGSCFPKDVRALIRMGEEHNVGLDILRATEASNERQKLTLVQMLTEFYGDLGGVFGKTVAVWGLAFKPATDDIREAPSLVVIKTLLELGVKVQAYDPEATDNVVSYFAGTTGVTICATKEEALKGSNALMIVTEWSEFRNPDLDTLSASLKDHVVFDGRNIYDPNGFTSKGLSLYQIGRKPRHPKSASEQTNGQTSI